MVTKVGQRVMKGLICGHCNSILVYDTKDIKEDIFSHACVRQFIVCSECNERIYLNLKEPPSYVNIFKMNDGYSV